MSITVQEFDELKNLLAKKYAQMKMLEKEVKFLKQTFMGHLEFRDKNDWKGKTDYATFSMKEGYKVSYPGNSDMVKKREFYQFLQKLDPNWYESAITLNWKSVNSYANIEIENANKSGNKWEPWPHTHRDMELQFDMRARSGVTDSLLDPQVKALGIKL